MGSQRVSHDVRTEQQQQIGEYTGRTARKYPAPSGGLWRLALQRFSAPPSSAAGVLARGCPALHQAARDAFSTVSQFSLPVLRVLAQVLVSCQKRVSFNGNIGLGPYLE